jgi:2-methylcitrate dehydratase PrpD
MDAAYSLAKNVVTTRYEDIPAEAVIATKKQILDTIGTALAGSSALGIKQLVELIEEWGGKRESTIISYGSKVPALHAAQANASMAHALDYDDTHEGGRIHCSVVVIPTALAMAERQGGIDGKDFITAVALGVDLACRMGLATELADPSQLQGGWHFTSLYGYFSAAATAGKILGLDEEQMVNALGIAYHQAAGNVQCVADGAMTKRMGPGFAARGGTMAALMAQKGITGSKNSLEAPERGLYDLYHAGCKSNELTDELGRRFEGINASLKPYPCCRLNHQYINLTLDLVHENHIKLDEIKEIIATVAEWTQDVCFPLEVKRNPRNIVDCQFSMPWTVACAVVHGKIGLAEFTEASLKDTTIKELAQKVTPVVDNSLPDPHSPKLVTIKTSRGEFSKKGGAILGSPQNPLTMEAITLKFKECATHGLKPLPKDSIDKIIEMVTSLEKLNDVNELVQVYTKPLG